MSVIVVGCGLFALGIYGVLTRRDLVAILACVEVMLGGALITLAGLGAATAGSQGGAHIEGITLLLLVVAASEAAVGLALLVVVAKRARTTRIDELTEGSG